MTIRSFISSLISFMLVLFLSSPLLSQNMVMGAGTLWCNIDGDTVTIGLNSNTTKDYFDVLGGNSTNGLMRIVWDKITAPADIKPQTIELKAFTNESGSVAFIWADFLTNTPYVIKSGKLIVTDNSGGMIKGTVNATVELGGSPIIGEFLKGKKESVLKNGYFEIKY